MALGRIFKWAFHQYTGTASSKVLLIVLARYADNTGTVSMNMAALLGLTELSRPTILKSLQALEKQQLIIIRQKSGKGSTMSVVITITPENGFTGKSATTSPPFDIQ